MTTNRPPSCDLPPEFYQANTTVIKSCPSCESDHVSDFDGYVICHTCHTYGPNNDRSACKWNSIPRRSEVLELLRLVDGLKHASSRTEVALALRYVIDCADKLRKEMGA